VPHTSWLFGVSTILGKGQADEFLESQRDVLDPLAHRLAEFVAGARSDKLYLLVKAVNEISKLAAANMKGAFEDWKKQHTH
jgi:hypothetical protein